MSAPAEFMDYPPAAREAAREMNRLGALGEPFLFLLDFEMQRPRVVPLTQAAESGIRYDFFGRTNLSLATGRQRPSIGAQPTGDDRARYQQAFDRVRGHLLRGDSYLANLTWRVPLRSGSTLEQIFQGVDAPCKVLVDDECVIFSPESFVSISQGSIATFPMKGTRPVTSSNSAEELLNDPKEIAEHATVVDLLRNDLSMVSEDVSVRRYRYLQQISTSRGQLLQTCSEICGKLSDDYQSRLGDIIFTLLPAGSVSGAPKHQALRIISQVEGGARGYYTGVFGIFDGVALESAVLIRFIERRDGALFFRSGGGITVNSRAEDEYQEMLEKVVLPCEGQE